MCFWAESINNNNNNNNNNIIIITTGWISMSTCIKTHIWNVWSKLCCLPHIISGLNIRQGNESGIVIKRNGKRLIRILKAWGCAYYITSFHSTGYRRVKNLIHYPHIFCNNEREHRKDVHHAIGQSGLKRQCLLFLILCTDSEVKCI